MSNTDKSKSWINDKTESDLNHANLEILDGRISEMTMYEMQNGWKDIVKYLYNSKSNHILLVKSIAGVVQNIITPLIKKRLNGGDKILIVTNALSIYAIAKDLSIIFWREENPIIKNNITIIGYRRFILDKHKDVINQDFDLAVFDNFNNGNTSQMYEKVNAFDGSKQILKIRPASVDQTPTGIYTSDKPILK